METTTGCCPNLFLQFLRLELYSQGNSKSSGKTPKFLVTESFYQPSVIHPLLVNRTTITLIGYTKYKTICFHVLSVLPKIPSGQKKSQLLIKFPSLKKTKSVWLRIIPERNRISRLVLWSWFLCFSILSILKEHQYSISVATYKQQTNTVNT